MDQKLGAFDSFPPKSSGLMLLLAGSIVLMGIITGESFYPPGYSTRLSQISDLGATEPPNSIITQPSATIFNLTMIISGLMILGAFYSMRKTCKKRSFTIPLGLFGLGVLGVGVFPGNVNPWHPISALMAFVFGGLSAIMAYRITSAPFRYISVLFGVTGLTFLFLAGQFTPILGIGGTERWVAYPIVLWNVGFGGYVLGRKK